MQVKKIETSIVNSETRFVLWVYCMDELEMKDRPYAFTWRNRQVSFMYGGWKGESRSIAPAQTLEEAQYRAEEWLEGWLRQLGALG